MQQIKWTCAFLALGLLIVSQSFAGHPLEHMIGKGQGDHRLLVMQYEEMAQADLAKAENWDFVADYYEKFPKEYSGTTMTVKEHIAHVRSVAEDFRKQAQQHRDLAAKHRAMERKGP
jgi:hypothetical protein